MSDSGSESDSSWLDRNYPVVILVLAIAVLVVLFFVVDAAPSSSLASLTSGVLVDLIAVLLGAAALYVLLGRRWEGFGAAISSISGRRAVESAEDAPQPSPPALLRRDELPPPSDLFENAHEVWVAAVSGLGLVNRFQGELKRLIDSGASLRVLLLDPQAKCEMNTWDRISNPPMMTPAQDIDSAYSHFKGLLAGAPVPAKCDVRRTPALLPFSLIVRNPHQDDGLAQVELHSFQCAPGDRPNVPISRAADRHWFDHFVAQFEALWEFRPSGDAAVGHDVHDRDAGAT